MGSGLSLVADHHRDGWNETQNKLLFSSDFVMPGAPHESWMLGYFKDGEKNVQCEGRAGHDQCTSNFKCSVHDRSFRGILRATSICANNDARVTQTAVFAANSLAVRVEVNVQVLVDGITDVKYMRNVDPDTHRGFNTSNEIFGQAQGSGGKSGAYSYVGAS